MEAAYRKTFLTRWMKQTGTVSFTASISKEEREERTIQQIFPHPFCLIVTELLTLSLLLTVATGRKTQI